MFGVLIESTGKRMERTCKQGGEAFLVGFESHYGVDARIGTVVCRYLLVEVEESRSGCSLFKYSNTCVIASYGQEFDSNRLD